MGEQSFPKSSRLSKTYEYRQVYRTGKRVPSANFLLFYRLNSMDESRVGISTGKKVGHAVKRNRVKRRMKEILRRQRSLLRRNVDLVLVAHPGAAALSFSEMESEITGIMKKARLL
jgi:ribonuclease P protein component